MNLATDPANGDITANRIAVGTTLRFVPIFGLHFDVNRIGGSGHYLGHDVDWGAWGFSVEGLISLW